MQNQQRLYTRSWIEGESFACGADCETHDVGCLPRNDASGYCLKGRHDATEDCNPTDRGTGLYK